jgi:hypothetical protein
MRHAVCEMSREDRLDVPKRDTRLHVGSIMRIAASTPTALTIRHPKIAPETIAAATPPTPHAVAPSAPPPAYLTRYGTPDAGFVMQLIATATMVAPRSQTDGPMSHAASAGAVSAYGAVHRPAQSASPGGRVARSV